MKAKIRHTEIYFDIAGMQLRPIGKQLIEKPIVFMLHGGPGGDHLRYKQHSLELQDSAQLVFIDHRGCGRSLKTKMADYTLENNIEDIEALRQYLGLKQICLLGTSYGGMVAQGYTIRYPKCVNKLILVATAPSYRFITDAKKYIQQHGNTQQIDMAEHLWNGTFKNAQHVKKYFKIMESLYSTTQKNNRKQGYSKSHTIWSYEALNKGSRDFLKHFDFIPKLKKITCPTLILAGQQDWICRPEQSKIIANHIPHSRLIIYKNCGHAIAVDAHKKYINVVRRFLR